MQHIEYTPEQWRELELGFIAHDIRSLFNSTYVESERTHKERVMLGRTLPQLIEQYKAALVR